MNLEVRLLSIIIRLLFIIIEAIPNITIRNDANLNNIRKEAMYWLDDDKLGENL